MKDADLASDQGSKQSDDLVSTVPGDNTGGKGMHAWVKPYYSHLEVMEFAANLRLKGLERRADRHKSVNYSELSTRVNTKRTKALRTPDLGR